MVDENITLELEINQPKHRDIPSSYEIYRVGKEDIYLTIFGRGEPNQTLEVQVILPSEASFETILEISRDIARQQEVGDETLLEVGGKDPSSGYKEYALGTDPSTMEAEFGVDIKYSKLELPTGHIFSWYARKLLSDDPPSLVKFTTPESKLPVYLHDALQDLGVSEPLRYKAAFTDFESKVISPG